MHSSGATLRCLMGIKKTRDIFWCQSYSSFPQALHVSYPSPHRFFPSPLPHTPIPKATTHGCACTSQRGALYKDANMNGAPQAPALFSVPDLCSCTRPSCPGQIPSTQLACQATPRPVLHLTPDSTPGLRLKPRWVPSLQSPRALPKPENVHLRQWGGHSDYQHRCKSGKAPYPGTNLMGQGQRVLRELEGLGFTCPPRSPGGN